MQIPKPSFNICSRPHRRGNGFVLVLDVGTTGIKTFIFDGLSQIVGKAYQKISKQRPKSGWIEQDPLEIIRVSRAVIKKVIFDSEVSISEIKGLGVTNQREATVLWDRTNGKPVYPIIGWEDRRTKRSCERIAKQDGAFIRERTGLVVDSYFSASKIRWILDHVPKAQTVAEQGTLAFGTIDTWLLWNLCDDQPHVTDETNASRTLLFDIQSRKWNQKLLDIFGVQENLLTRVLPSRALYGVLKKEIAGLSIPVVAVCGDQQSSTYAAMCVEPNIRSTTKVTYGTGAFLVQVLGKTFSLHDSFFTTLVPAIGEGSCYAYEMKVEGSGETVDRLLQNPPKLIAYFNRLSKKVDKLIVKLPTKPRQIIVDGGVARDGYVVEIQQKNSGISTCLQSPFDGTALGCALLCWDQIETKKSDERLI